MGDKSAKARLVSQIASRQHGVITVSQLSGAGVERDVASKWARARRLHRIHRGVYAVGHVPRSRKSKWMAAVLACGDGAALSHASAAALWGLLDWRDGPVEVSIPVEGGRRPRAGVRIHRRPGLPHAAITRRHNIPVTRPAQTIADLRGRASDAQLRRAIRQAEVLGFPTGLDHAADPTQSEMEDLFLALCRRNALPEPQVNVRIDALIVDFLWSQRRLVVETDGYRFHRGPSAFENDHDRDLRLRTLGYDVLRLTYRHLATEPTRVAALVRRELSKPSQAPRQAPIRRASE
jgi:very-short-patch-repair endonuclease